MNVLHVIERFTGYGCGHQLASIYKELHIGGLQQSFLAIRENTLPWEDLPSATIHSLGISGSRTWHAAFRFSKLLSKIKPDIVHFWFESVPAWMVGICRAFSNSLVFCSTEKMANRSLAAKLQNRIFQPNATVQIGPAQAMLTACHHDAFGASQSLTIPKVAPTQHRVERSYRTEFLRSIQCEPSDKLIVTVADLEPASRLKDLIWATDLIKCIREDVHLVIVGVGKQRKKLEKFADQASVGRHVHFAGDRTDAAKIVSVADVYWGSDPSRYAPDGVLWALNAGVPIIAADSKNNTDLIENGENGLIIRTGARDDYARKANQVLNHPQQYKSICDSAIKSIDRTNTARQVAEQIMKIYGHNKRLARKVA